jgi:hypothetical protein
MSQELIAKVRRLMLMRVLQTPGQAKTKASDKT